MSLTIQQSVSNIVAAARIAVELGGMSASDALDMAAHDAKASAHAARTRDGIWASETKGEAIEDMCFQGSVASDILDGTVIRPSTGNVRSYALRLLND